MWKIFYSKEKDFNLALKSIETFKKEIFHTMERKVKEYFSQKVVLHFDNMMIFNHKNGIHNNLLESLSNAEKEMQDVFALFLPVNLYLLKEESGTVAIISGLENKYSDMLKKHGFDLLKDDATPMNGKEEEMRYLSWSTLLFDVDLVNYSKSWIDFAPSSEKRTELQTEYILMHMHFKKTETTLLDRVNFGNNIKTHPQYPELLQKITKIMPKIQDSMEQEWSIKDTQQKVNDTIGKVKKNKPI